MRRHAVSLCLLSALATGVGSPAHAGGDFVLRVHDSVTRPGQRAAIVLSTYEPQPIEQGQLRFRILSGPTLVPDQAVVLGDIADAHIRLSPQTGGELIVDFGAPSGAINAMDGPMIALFVDVPAGAPVGASWWIDLDAANSWLRIPGGANLPLEPRDATLTVVDARAPYVVSAEGDKVLPGETARVSVETLEPLPLSGAEILLRYDASLLVGAPQVQARSRTAALTYTVDARTRGEIRVRVRTTDPRWNAVPGPLVDVWMPTDPGAAVGTIAPLELDPAATRLRTNSGRRVPLFLESGEIEIPQLMRVADGRRFLFPDGGSVVQGILNTTDGAWT